MQDQTKIARHVMAALAHSQLFDAVELCGSVAKNEHDELSDIDILVSCYDRSPKDNVELASAIVEANFGIALRGWSLALLPDKYLISHFLPDTAIFWWLDIGCMPTSQFAPLQRSDVESDLNSHIAKLWVMNAKHMLRGTESRLRIRALYSKVFGPEAACFSEIAAFQAVFNRIDFTQLDQGFHIGCMDIMQQLLDKYPRSLTCHLR